MPDEKTAYEGWAIVELMGHRRLGGYVSQTEMYGTVLLRIDIPGPQPDKPVATQYYGGQSIYCLTPTTEETVRAFAARNQPAPVQRWELPALESRPAPPDPDDDDGYDDDYQEDI